VTITFNLPDDDDGEGFDVTYSIGGNTFNLLAIINGHSENHIVTVSTIATLLLVENNDDDDDDCFTVFSQSVSITVSNPVLTITNQTDPSCGQNDGSITASTSNGIAPYEYSLNGGPFQFNGAFTNLGAGAYNVVAQDAIGCTDQQTVVLTSSDEPTVSITNQANPACGQSNGSLTATAAGGTSPYQYSLNGGNFQNSGAFTGLGAGSYTIVAQDAAGCTASVSTTLTSSGGPTLTIANQTNPACGQSNGSITAVASGGISPYQFSLGGTIYQASPTFSGLAAGTYQVFVKDASNCIDIETATLTDPGTNLPQANISANATSGCATTIFILTGNLPAGTTGLWTSDEVQPPAPSNPVWELSDLPPGSATVTWTLSAPGCPNYNTAALTVNVLPPPVANTDGIFNVEQGEFAEADVLLNDLLPAPVEARILKNPAQGTAFLNTQNILEYQPNATADGMDTAVYEICYFECPDACDTALVLFRNLRNDDPCVITGDTSYVFTNGLTPNDDGRNDYLVFRAVSVEDCEINYAKSEIIIYNRWGDIVFEASPYNNKWGGKNRNDQDLPPGVYYFVLRITLDKVYSQFGSVILIR
jgi:gliding motility-associated-like protein